MAKKAKKKAEQNGKAVAKKNGFSDLKFWGWRRKNGRVGVRNHVIILPLDDLSNAACEAVANNIKGTMALPHAYGRLQFGEDLDLHFRTLIGTGANPNVAAVVVIGIEDGWTKRVVDGIAKTGKPVVGFGIEGHGDIATIAKASDASRASRLFQLLLMVDLLMESSRSDSSAGGRLVRRPPCSCQRSVRPRFRVLDLLQDLIEVVARRVLHRRELLVGFQLLQPQRLADWQHVPIVDVGGGRRAD